MTNDDYNRDNELKKIKSDAKEQYVSSEDISSKKSSEFEMFKEILNKNNDFIISVSDNGIGMSKEEIRKIFDRFFRVSKGDIHNVKGFGLGLSYVKLIVEEHGGSISVKSSEGKETEVTIKLKLINGTSDEPDLENPNDFYKLRFNTFFKIISTKNFIRGGDTYILS